MKLFGSSLTSATLLVLFFQTHSVFAQLTRGMELPKPPKPVSVEAGMCAQPKIIGQFLKEAGFEYQEDISEIFWYHEILLIYVSTPERVKAQSKYTESLIVGKENQQAWVARSSVEIVGVKTNPDKTRCIAFSRLWDQKNRRSIAKLLADYERSVESK